MSHHFFSTLKLWHYDSEVVPLHRTWPFLLIFLVLSSLLNWLLDQSYPIELQFLMFRTGLACGSCPVRRGTKPEFLNQAGRRRCDELDRLRSIKYFIYIGKMFSFQAKASGEVLRIIIYISMLPWLVSWVRYWSIESRTSTVCSFRLGFSISVDAAVCIWVWVWVESFFKAKLGCCEHCELDPSIFVSEKGLLFCLD